MKRDSSDRSLPVFVTLLVIGVLMMTFGVRNEGGGVVGVLEAGVQGVVAPVQKAANFLISPLIDAYESVTSLASLREENLVLRAELAEAQAELFSVQDRLAQLVLFEQLYELDPEGGELGTTLANVVGFPNGLDQSFIIDKGSSDGVIAGQPVIDTNGFVVGQVKASSPNQATVIPITVSRDGLIVLVGNQVGRLVGQAFRDEMRLEVLEAREPILSGERVVTAAGSVSYPAGLAVGEVVGDTGPATGSIVASVRPFLDVGSLQLVIVLAWPPDPIQPLVDDATTTTTLPESTSTSVADDTSTTNSQAASQ